MSIPAASTMVAALAAAPPLLVFVPTAPVAAELAVIAPFFAPAFFMACVSQRARGRAWGTVAMEGKRKEEDEARNRNDEIGDEN